MAFAISGPLFAFAYASSAFAQSGPTPDVTDNEIVVGQTMPYGGRDFQRQ
ncbi:hypothetical protein AB8A05_28325 [Tardiphaga sp. 538_B7_N1_4]